MLDAAKLTDGRLEQRLHDVGSCTRLRDSTRHKVAHIESIHGLPLLLEVIEGGEHRLHYAVTPALVLPSNTHMRSPSHRPFS